MLIVSLAHLRLVKNSWGFVWGSGFHGRGEGECHGAVLLSGG